MKLKNYEKTFLINFLSILIIIVFIVSLLLFKIKFIRTYSSISSTVVKNNLIYFLVDDKQLSYLHNNKYFIANGKKYLINIEQINKNVLKRNEKNYHSVLLKVNLNKKYKENDFIKILLFNKKIDVYSMIKTVWGR